MTGSGRAAGIEEQGRRLIDGGRTREERLEAAGYLGERTRMEWADVPEEVREDLAAGMIEIIGDTEGDAELRAAAAKALRAPVPDLSAGTNGALFAVLTDVIQEAVDRRMAQLLAETCRLVSASRVMECDMEPLLKAMNDAIFNAVLLGKSTGDEVFTAFADDAFGRSRNRLNQLHGDWD